jgi:hypothetical protein
MYRLKARGTGTFFRSELTCKRNTAFLSRVLNCEEPTLLQTSPFEVKEEALYAF